jgi:hypothetical protein
MCGVSVVAEGVGFLNFAVDNFARVAAR